MNSLDFAALEKFASAPKNMYLEVSKTKGQQHLKAVERGPLGRFFMWLGIKLGCSNARLDKVASHVASQMKQVTDDAKIATLPGIEKLLKKISSYNEKKWHKTKLTNEYNGIKDRVEAAKASLLPKPTAPVIIKNTNNIHTPPTTSPSTAPHTPMTSPSPSKQDKPTPAAVPSEKPAATISEPVVPPKTPVATIAVYAPAHPQPAVITTTVSTSLPPEPATVNTTEYPKSVPPVPPAVTTTVAASVPPEPTATTPQTAGTTSVPPSTTPSAGTPTKHVIDTLAPPISFVPPEPTATTVAPSSPPSSPVKVDPTTVSPPPPVNVDPTTVPPLPIDTTSVPPSASVTIEPPSLPPLPTVNVNPTTAPASTTENVAPTSALPPPPVNVDLTSVLPPPQTGSASVLPGPSHDSSAPADKDKDSSPTPDVSDEVLADKSKTSDLEFLNVFKGICKTDYKRAKSLFAKRLGQHDLTKNKPAIFTSVVNEMCSAFAKSDVFPDPEFFFVGDTYNLKNEQSNEDDNDTRLHWLNQDLTDQQMNKLFTSFVKRTTIIGNIKPIACRFVQFFARRDDRFDQVDKIIEVLEQNPVKALLKNRFIYRIFNSLSSCIPDSKKSDNNHPVYLFAEYYLCKILGNSQSTSKAIQEELSLLYSETKKTIKILESQRARPKLANRHKKFSSESTNNDDGHKTEVNLLAKAIEIAEKEQILKTSSPELTRLLEWFATEEGGCFYRKYKTQFPAIVLPSADKV